MIVRHDHKKSHLPNVLIADDTDLPKSGMHMESIGKIFSHVHRLTSRFMVRRARLMTRNKGLPLNRGMGDISANVTGYAMRWSIEVFFSDSKRLLGLANCSSRDFSAHIAHVSLVMIRYNMLASIKWTLDYETIGGLFGNMYIGMHE